MADFYSDLNKGPLGSKVLPNGDALKRKVDYNRENWLKGVSTTKFGKKEDPTYLHFKFIFDFGNTQLIDPETFLAPSPLFRPMEPPKNGQVNAAVDIAGANFDSATNQINNSTYLLDLEAKGKINGGNFTTDEDFFYGSKLNIDGKNGRGVFPINGGGVAYYGAQEYLSQRSTKRQQMLSAFRNGLSFINEKCPYYFQSISGLDQLLKVDIKNLHKAGGKPQRMGTLTVDCLESIDMRIFALAELYRKAMYDYTYHRVMVPENLRKFRMWLVVSEIRNVQLTYGINDILNPFSIPSVANAANFLDSFNSQTGLLNEAQGILQKSTPTSTEYTDKFGNYTLGPYAFIYQFDQCEFDFDDSYPSFSTIDNKGLNTPVSNKFKIHVGRVRDHKIQFNELADVMKKDDNIKSMVLSDVWGSSLSGYQDYDYAGSTGITSVDLSSGPNPKEYFAQMAANFINNSVADLKNQGVSILEGALLGNIYGLGGLNIGASTSSAQSLINTLKGGIPNPFADNSPQAKGLGGPPENKYSSINEDVYPGVPNSTQSNLGTAYSSNGNSPTPSNLGNNYPDNKESSQYPKNSSDEYLGVPGSDLGVPGRIYPEVKDDLYKNVPGSDLGGTDRQYPKNNDDEYKGVPGSDLGVPSRIYNTVKEDVYNNVPGTDLGEPLRDYPNIKEDVYPDDNKVNTNIIGKAFDNPDPQYPSADSKEYPNIQSNVDPQLGDIYPDDTIKYPQVLEPSAYKDPEPKYQEPMGDAYRNDPPVNLEPDYSDRVYKDNQFYTMGENMGDVYPTVPGKDLGLPSRNYNIVKDTEYTQSQPIRVNNIGRTYPTGGNENN